MKQKKIVNTDKAPAAIGIYSQGTISGDMAYISGQIPLDPISMEIVIGDFDKQATQVFKNLDAVANACGANLNHFIKLTIYLTNLKYFQNLNTMMENLFDAPFPARAVIEVSALPKGALIEIEGIIDLSLSA
jgi:2-iminobutanoate/2-iminopropanoate deaminase